jgi:RimJ/RimL family protein N-acetyltransferase
MRLVDFRPEDIASIGQWFGDPETQLRLGGRDWIARAPSLLSLPTGVEFRGKVVTGRRMWLLLDDDSLPVAFVDGETYDRYAAWDGSNADSPIVSDVVAVSSMGLSMVVDPMRRSRGYGTAALLAVVEHPDNKLVRLFFGSVDADNLASARCFARAGFSPRSSDPDFEGMLIYTLERLR